MFSFKITLWMALLGTIVEDVFGVQYTTVPYEDLVQPTTLASSNGVFQETISFEMTTFVSPDYSIAFRSFNSSLHGFVLRLQPGDRILLNYTNNMPDTVQNTQNEVMDEFCEPEETNLHFHGLVISGEAPSDDVVGISLKPTEWYQYDTQLPSIHMPGTHWLHPHRHGSASLQIGAFAAAAIVVEDAEGYLPSPIQDAREIIMMVQDITLSELSTISSRSNDTLFQYNTSFDAPPLYSWENGLIFNIVNGQIQPIIRMFPGEWVRMRIISALWNTESHRNLGLTIPGCEMQLLAKDGVYISDFPREITIAPIPRGGRADLMVRCMFEGMNKYTIYENTHILATIELPPKTIANRPVSSTDLPAWTPPTPSYLQDLTQQTLPSPSCRCDTNLTNPQSEGNETFRLINGQAFSPDAILHQSYLGAVVERRLFSNFHVYHQHVYPFQLMERDEVTSCRDLENCDEYFRVGDWQDTYEGTAIIRYQPTLYETHVILHCHIIAHEDLGMMSQEYVGSNAEASPCTCNDGPTHIMEEAALLEVASPSSSLLSTLLVVAIVSIVLVALIAIIRHRQSLADGHVSRPTRQGCFLRGCPPREGYGAIESEGPSSGTGCDEERNEVISLYGANGEHV